MDTKKIMEQVITNSKYGTIAGGTNTLLLLLSGCGLELETDEVEDVARSRHRNARHYKMLAVGY
jgi:hypothetical protein